MDTQSTTAVGSTARPFRAAREARGWSLRKTGEVAHIDPSALSRFERGRGSLSLAAVARLARALGLADVAYHIACIDSTVLK